MDAPRYPVMLDVAGRRCLVVGGGTVAARKVAGLLDCGADVTVVAPVLDAGLSALVADGSLTWHQRPFDAVDLADASEAGGVAAGTGDGEADASGVADAPLLGTAGAARRWWLVVVATDDPDVNRAVARECERRGTWVIDASTPGGGSASNPAVHRRGPLTVAVSTGGVSPGAAAWLRDELAAAVDPAVATAMDILRELAAAEAGGRPGSRAPVDWQQVLDSGTLDDIRHGRLARAKERLQACLSSSSD